MVRPIPGVLIEAQPEPVLLRMCGWAEARGEPRRGLLAVLHVIRNRALKADSTLGREITRPWQFSSFNQDDPNRGLLMKAADTDRVTWSAVDAVCELFEQGCTVDPTGGATHYYVDKMENPPKWGLGHPTWQDLGLIGRHRFGKQT